MSGHSKWSTIKRQKGVADAKRGQQFTKLANAIVISIRQGGGITDPEFNFKLRLAVDKARSFNMPKENIERAIAKAKGSMDSGDLQEAVYEGFAPGGAALIIECVTDNKQRTVSEVKNALEKNGGTMGNQGSVSYLFSRVGEIAIDVSGKSSDDLLELALEIESEDFIEEGTDAIFYVDPTKLFEAKKTLEAKGLIVNSAELVFKPLNVLTPDEDSARKIESIIEKVEELGDVQNVFTNAAL
ncbi:MAG: YebC/PmpR family DNA-binding transcriptional regulator [Candidatus Levyibacteriota bacterium]